MDIKLITATALSLSLFSGMALADRSSFDHIDLDGDGVISESEWDTHSWDDDHTGQGTDDGMMDDDSMSTDDGMMDDDSMSTDDGMMDDGSMGTDDGMMDDGSMSTDDDMMMDDGSMDEGTMDSESENEALSDFAGDQDPEIMGDDELGGESALGDEEPGNLGGDSPPAIPERN